MPARSLSFVGAAGGVGTTRLAVESGTLLAGTGRDVAILDAAYGTQGLSDLTQGRIDPDATELCLDDAPLEEGLLDRPVDGAGRLAVCPARAPFERVARAKTPEAAQALGDRIEEAERAFDHVLVDVPPVATNPSVAAVTTTEAIAVVCDGGRAPSAVPRTEDRLADVGAGGSRTVVTWRDDHPDADETVPPLEESLPAVESSPDAHNAVASVLETALDVEIERVEQTGLRTKLPV